MQFVFALNHKRLGDSSLDHRRVTASSRFPMIGTATAFCRTPTGLESTSSDGMFPLRQSLGSTLFGNTKAQKDPSHDYPIEDQESGSRTESTANRRLSQEVGRTPSLLPLLSLWTVTAGPSGERRSSSLGCVRVHSRITIAASASSSWSLAV